MKKRLISLVSTLAICASLTGNTAIVGDFNDTQAKKLPVARNAFFLNM